VSAYPVMLEGAGLAALVVGGGTVATRKAFALLEAGAVVRVVSPTMNGALDAAAGTNDRLTVVRERYAAHHISDAMLVVAATDDPTVNAVVAADARARQRLINVVTAPELGNCITAATHRAGDVVVAVTAGGVPSAAVRIRDEIAGMIDTRYAHAVEKLAVLRRSLLAAGERERWAEAAAALVGADFCENVESGQFDARLGAWR
jgi:precorrin-2 dehydrogenase/sirohydrochlorin ferrochelatase